MRDVFEFQIEGVLCRLLNTHCHVSSIHKHVVTGNLRNSVLQYDKEIGLQDKRCIVTIEH